MEIMDLGHHEQHNTPWNFICNSTNSNASSSKNTNIMCYLQNQHEIIHIAFYVVSFCAFLTSLAILIMYCKCAYKMSKASENYILFFCCIVTTVADLAYDKERDRVKFNIYTAVILGVFGICTFLGGSFLFFAKTEDAEERLGNHHEGTGIIVCSIAVPLVVIELMIFVTELLHPNAASAIVDMTSLLQMAIQAGVYQISLRNKRPVEEKKHGAALLFKIAALVNFSMWLQSIMTSEYQSEEHFEHLFNTESRLVSIFAALYSALIIDYRLLCCLLFLEHAHEIDEPSENALHANQHIPQGDGLGSPIPDLNTNIFTLVGWVFGLLMLSASVINGTQYLWSIGSWSDIFPCLIQIVVVYSGFALLKQVQGVRNDWTHWRESSSVDGMVALMGVFGMAFWLLKGFIIAVWHIKVPRHILDNQLAHFQTDASYLVWQSIKFFVRALCIMLQIVFFMKINSSIGRAKKIFENRWNHFFLPVMIAGLLSIFVNSLIDSFSGFVEENVRKAGFCSVINILYNSGMPIHLGFCIHLFLHFLIIYIRMCKAVKNEQRATPEAQPLTQSVDT